VNRLFRFADPGGLEEIALWACQYNTLAWTTRCGSSTPLLMSWTLQRRGLCVSSRRRRVAPAMRQPISCIYGYLNWVRSSRRPEMKCHRNIEAARAILDVDTRGRSERS
jgi:hypothetical protein